MRWLAALPGPLRGALWMLLEAISMAATVAAVRELSATVPTFEIIFWRALIGLAIQLPWALRHGRAVLWTPASGLVALRTFLVIAAMVLWYAALGAMPITDAVALQFTLPLFAILGAGLLLRERVGARRWAGAAVGFAGALVIIRPGLVAVDPMALVVLVSAALVAGVQLVTKALAGIVPGAILALHMNLFMLAFALVAATPDWLTPAPAEMPWLLVVGLFSTGAHVLLARAMNAADASVVAPIDFARLPFAALFGWVLFREASDLWTWAGAAVIFASATYTTRREARMATQKRRQGG